MAENTTISWCRSTFNPWLGCTKISPGCDHCYASVSTPARSLGVKWGAGEARRRTSTANWTLPLRWNRQARQSEFAGRRGFWPVFCGSLCDLFDNEVPEKWRTDLFHLIAATPNLTWLLLTKRIGSVASIWPLPWRNSGMPNNLWLGATIVNQEEADRDIPKLLATPAAMRFVSYEPALDAVDWSRWLSATALHEMGGGPRLNWIIVGGESDQPGMKARPFNVEWARSTVRQCRTTGVPVFVKQLGSNVICTEADRTGYKLDPRTGNALPMIVTHNRAGADPGEWPHDLRVRDFPHERTPERVKEIS